ncbi:hypothetical protein [Pedobacter sp. UBA4863]|uniref:hypothetical protein n=1 Tax=Pedobacter sp. UBA4863 TaxID=1947060 RepID=UPI0025D5CB8A|nr:hypothetical protein [Pedobacter sp. UBA4863]
MKSFLFKLSVFSLLLLSACSKKGDDLEAYDPDDDKIIIASSKDRPGLGESDEMPLGTPLHLPEGIRIVERKHYKFDPNIEKLYAHVNYFYVDVNLVNDRMPGTPPVYVEFPAGLIGVSMDHDKQNGLSIERYLIPVPPTERIGGGRDTTTIYIGMACLNKSRSMPWYDNQGEEMNYPISRNNFQQFVVTTDVNLLKFLEVVKNKPQLRVKQHWDPVAAHEPDYITPEWLKIYGDIDNMIWDITDGYGVKQKEIKALKRKLDNYR